MPLLIVIALMALPFLEIWLMVVVAGWIGVPWTIGALFALTVSGVFVVRRAGTKAFRDADAAMRTGKEPEVGLLDTLMVMVGGILLIIPGFITAALGALLSLPFTRPALRWAFQGWARRRMEKMQARMDTDLAAMGVRVRRPDDGRPGSGTVIRGTVVENEQQRREPEDPPSAIDSESRG
ncbi:UPF0716 protein FxsA [Murinocardiopsis flavida]|uniref:UPF0716 protein FxsA n=1 Tax=Murinocardiopsis flavida TaxID=645275 RepID=A0A2P8DLD1_9ACTN|nr:FxsA family protein [Murinocardiopsis flavida]PSK98025.1 UPF0716 protein FxsA [Murinocardiopsis flavida]